MLLTVIQHLRGEVVFGKFVLIFKNSLVFKSTNYIIITVLIFKNSLVLKSTNYIIITVFEEFLISPPYDMNDHFFEIEPTTSLRSSQPIQSKHSSRTGSGMTRLSLVNSKFSFLVTKIGQSP